MIYSLIFVLVFPFFMNMEKLSEGNVTVIFPPRLKVQAETSLKLYRMAAGKVRARTGLKEPESVTIELADSENLFWSAYKRLGGRGRPEHALAVAFSPSNVMLIRTTHLSGIGPGNLPETLIHETFHLFLGRLLFEKNKSVPLWFNEGCAQWTAGQEVDKSRADLLRTKARAGRLPSLDSLSKSFPGGADNTSLAYAQSLMFIEWLESSRPGSVVRILDLLGNRNHFETAVLDGAGTRLSELEVEFKASLSREHSFLGSFLRQVTLFSLLSLVAIAAFVRYLYKRKKLRRKLEQEERQGFW